jgi:hypothetical protein
MINVAVRIEDELGRRGIRLSGRGPERCGPCPVCGGTDRFSINTKKQVWNCRGCAKGGDVIALVEHLDAADFKEACSTLGVDGQAEIAAAKPRSETADNNSSRAGELWRAAAPIAGTLAEVYLRSRGLDYADPGGEVLRFHGRCRFGPGTVRPCIVALFRGIIGDKPAAIHRTALTPDGRKIDRMTLGPIGAAAIKLTRDDDVEYGLHIGEGLETTLAGMALSFKSAWALGSAGGIRAFPVFDGVDCLTILVDHDNPDRHGRQAGHVAARECSQRWRNAGREVLFVVPHVRGHDMADLVGTP